MVKADLTYDKVKAAVEKAGFKFFTGEMNINMIGVRSKNRQVDNWDDFFVLCWQEAGKNMIWVDDQFTTDPGIYYMTKKLLNPEGCGILARGQYRGVWIIGMHNGKYEAFLQRGCKVKAYRDRDKNNIMTFDPKTLKEGMYGANQHHGYDSKGGVGANSAMCQVHRYKKDLAYVLSMAKKNIKAGWGDSFTYTLLEEGIDF